MLDEFKKDDFLTDMRIITRDGSVGTYGSFDAGFWFRSILIKRWAYTDDLRYSHPGKTPEECTPFDIMKVYLPSGAVLWERPAETPAEMACSGCDRDGTGDPICGGCMRGGHGMTVDFYRPKVGP